MTGDRGTLTALHLLLVWVLATAVVPTLGFAVFLSAWGGGAGATLPVSRCTRCRTRSWAG
ncbi:hypothetical protein [Streptomyces sp. NPDC001843]|uniref:hypothetical protein n=1 Tax=Streptomyces sp. NPDC001843 TaxID=3364617 RepID=UPI003697BE42